MILDNNYNMVKGAIMADIPMAENNNSWKTVIDPSKLG